MIPVASMPVPRRANCHGLNEPIETFHHSHLGCDDHTGPFECRRNRPDLNFTRFAIRLHDGETPSVEGSATIRFVVFVTRWVSIVCPQERSCALYLEGN